jgi:ankyrin repeat protein
MNNVAQLLIENKADLNLKDNLGRSPFYLCFETENFPLLELLMGKVSINKDPDLFFAFKDKIINVEYQVILESLIKNDPPSKEAMNCLDDNGFSPFLAYIKTFT